MKTDIQVAPLGAEESLGLPFQREAFERLEKQEQVLFERFGQGPAVELPFAKVHHAFEKYAKYQPELVAAEYQGQKITYGELNRQANLLAVLLSEYGVGPGEHVGLFLERSIAMLVGILGVLKTGAAYVPQDARITPTVQLQHILRTAKARVTLTMSHLKHRVPLPNGHTSLAIDELMQEMSMDAPAKDFTASESGSSNDTCFVLFTSGTTGMPNGVLVSHRNLCNILHTDPGNLQMQPGRRVSQILNISFDMAAWEVLGALSHGATLVIRGKSIAEAVERADTVIATPSILSSLDVERCRHVKVAAVAGEPCPMPLAERWSDFCDFHNSCGPTETTIVNTVQRFSGRGSNLTIGKPTPNNTVYILDEKLQPCSIGEIGEMWAGGLCVSKGYLGNKRLTNDRYRPDPFLGGDHMMFRTRDLGRWTEEGELEHFGRTDDQVKIKGFRVELDSVSNALESVPSCKQAVTLKLDSQNLVAFVQPRTVDLEHAKKAVEALLPYYCTPSLILPLDEFPITSRGKIDKRALTILAVEEQEQLGSSSFQSTKQKYNQSVLQGEKQA